MSRAVYTEEWLAEYVARMQKCKDPLQKVVEKHGFKGTVPVKKPSKYRNLKVVVEGITFDSAKESRRYNELWHMERAGEISRLTRQKSFVLAPSVVLNGRKKPELRYVCDFHYWRNGVEVVEDVKSEMTRKLPVYRVKAHLLKHLFQIDITEI